MIILVVNTGSSSLKYQLFDMDDHKVLAKGLCERIGEDGHMNYKTDAGTVFDKDIALPDHGVAMQLVIDALTDKEYGVISDMSEIGAVGHRIVQGGYLFDKSEIITDEVEKGIEELCVIGPLHNPPALVGIRACKKVLPNTPGVVVFDTTFHRTMADECKYYAIPWEYAEKYHVQRYGAHGTSHRYVSERCAVSGSLPYSVYVCVSSIKASRYITVFAKNPSDKSIRSPSFPSGMTDFVCLSPIRLYSVSISDTSESPASSFRVYRKSAQSNCGNA